MLIQVQLFARLREDVGAESIDVQIPGSNPTVGQLRALIQQSYPRLKMLNVCRVAVNHEFVDDEHPIEPNDELALIPPVSGG